MSVVVLDGARQLGAKILVSGGSRCNVTNARVTDGDFWGGRRTIIRRVLRGLSVDETVAFFREIGVPTHEEEDGKLFPDSNRARDVINALVGAARDAGVTIVTGRRVRAIETRGATSDHEFRVETPEGSLGAGQVVLATGGRSLPKSGSDGAGFEIARRLGHSIVPTTPALVPLLLDQADTLHRELTGVAHDAELSLWMDGAVDIRLRGSLLWTHFGVSGPVALNISRHWLRAKLERRDAELTLSFCPERTFEDIERWWIARTRERPQSSISTALSALTPASVADALLSRLQLRAETTLAHMSREGRRTLSHALVRWPLRVTGERGYNVAEATAGGVSLDEIDPATMRSRVCAGLSLVGEILDVDGRIGGFNFQWAWSSARVAASALGT
jgi:predicted Rossmann fold flavoprotein